MSAKIAGQVGIQAVVGVGASAERWKQLAGVDEVALGFDGIIFDFRGDVTVGHLSVVDAIVTALDVAGEVLADEAIEQGAENILFEIPAIDRATNIIGDLPDLALQGGALLDTCHSVVPISNWFGVRCGKDTQFARATILVSSSCLFNLTG